MSSNVTKWAPTAMAASHTVLQWRGVQCGAQENYKPEVEPRSTCTAKHVTAFEIQTADGLMAVNLWHDHTLNDIITCRDGFPRFTDVKSVFFSLPKTSLFLFFPLLVTWQVDMTAAPVLFQQTSFWPEWWQLMVNFLILPRFTLNNTTAATPEHSGACRRKDMRIKCKITYREITKTWMLLCLKK